MRDVSKIKRTFTWTDESADPNGEVVRTVVCTLILHHWFESHPYGMGTAREPMEEIVGEEWELDEESKTTEEMEAIFSDEQVEEWVDDTYQNGETIETERD